MENNNLINFVQQGFRTVIGATAEALETIQNSDKRNQVISELSSELEKKSQEWRQKGTLTEEEAKKIIEKIFQGKEYTSDVKNNYTEEVEVTTVDNPYKNIQQLTQEIISLREELEKTNKS